MLPNTRAVWLATVVQCVTGGLGVTLIPQTAAAVETTRSRLELARFVAPARRDESVWCLALSAREKSYQRLAGIIGKLIRGDRQVRLIA